MDFYGKFLRLCNQRGMSPAQALQEVGMKKSATTRWKGGGMPTDANLRKIADYFGVTPDSLEPDPPAPTARTENDDESRLLKYYYFLNNEGRAKLLSNADDMVRSGKYGGTMDDWFLRGFMSE